MVAAIDGKRQRGVMRSGKRSDVERSTSVRVADHMLKLKLSASCSHMFILYDKKETLMILLLEIIVV